MAVSFITLSYSFGSIFYHCIYGCMLRMLLFNFVYYAFLLLFSCILIVIFMNTYCYVCSISLCCSVLLTNHTKNKLCIKLVFLYTNIN